jgi:predicted Zn-dependent protease
MLPDFWQISKSLHLFGMFAGLVLVGCGGPASAGMSAEEQRLAALMRPCNPDSFDLSCMQGAETEVSDAVIATLGGLKDDLVKQTGDDVPIAVEEEYGDQTLESMRTGGGLNPKHPEQQRLEGMLHKLLEARPIPSQRAYHIYVIENSAVNAFTMGAEIFVTTALLQGVESNDELACVIGHEIGHNELGHIAAMIQERELATGLLGEAAGEALASAAGLLTVSFNQLNEAAADIYGIDIALASGFNPCRGIAFWDRVGRQEGPANEWENLLRSHPYSKKRAQCYRAHLSEHHEHRCE